MFLSNKLEHILCVPNNEMKPDRRMVTTKSSEDVWDKIGRTRRAGGKFQDALQVRVLINFS
jgi:hypothetical protein